MKWIGQNIYDLASKFRNIVDFSENVTFYQPVNGADPEISIGSSATERLRININYQGSASISAQGIGFKTFTESTTANDGKMTFSPDENYVLAIDDGGIDFQTGYGISINGADIITDSSGTATLSNIDALDATTEATIETAIDTLANLTSVGTIGTGVWEGTTIKTAYIGNDQVTEDKLADTLLAEIDANTAKNTNVTTNLSTTTSTTTVRVDSSDGTNATLPVATTSIGGVMSKAMFDEHTANNAKNTNVVGNLTAVASEERLTVATSNGSDVNLPAATNTAWGAMTDNLVEALEANTAKNTNVVTNLSVASSTGSRIIASSDGTNATIPVATTSVSGVMSTAIFDEHTANNAKNTSSNVYGDYIRLLPSDFATNADGGNSKLGVAYVNTAGTGYGMKVPSNDTELFAFVSIPEGMKATHVEIFGKRTRGIEVFEVQINATTMTSKGTGNCNTELSITNVDATATNLLAIYVDITSVSADRVYGGRVKIAAQ